MSIIRLCGCLLLFLLAVIVHFCDSLPFLNGSRAVTVDFAVIVYLVMTLHFAMIVHLAVIVTPAMTLHLAVIVPPAVIVTPAMTYHLAVTIPDGFTVTLR